MEKERTLYSLGEASKITGIEKETLRKYTSEFNIQTEWTQPNNEGHRRYTKENIELLLKIKEKIQEQNWSWKQVRGWLNGEIDYFTDHEEKSNLEKKMDLILEELAEQKRRNEERDYKQEQFNRAVLQKMQERDQVLLETMNQKMEEKRNESFFKKIFSSKKNHR